MLEGPELEQLKRFLFQHIEDLEELAVVVAVHARPPITLEELLKQLPLPVQNVREAVEGLLERGLLVQREGPPAVFALAELEPARRFPLARLVEEYRANPLQLMGLMNANSLERVRTAALRTFAEAFRLGEPKKHG